MAKRFLEDMIQVKNANKIKRENDISSTVKAPLNTKKDELQENKKQSTKETNKEIKTEIKKTPYLKNTKAYFDNDGYREVIDTKQNSNNYFLWFLVVLVVVISFFNISSRFSKANITIDPKIEEFTLEESLIAKKDLSQTETDLSYQLIIVDGNQSKIITAEGEKEVKEKATGKVVLYNAFATSPQKLNVDTRLIGSNNKIYKTKEAVTIPAMISNSFGSIEVEIYAEKEGEEYNSGPLDFQILGFKGTTKFDKIYGRSKGEIAGGFAGNKKIVNEESFNQTKEELENALELRLLEKALDQIPNDYILFRDATFYNLDSQITNNSGTNNEAEVTASGTLYGFIFNKKNLENYILDNKFQDKKGNYYISNLKDLVFEIIDKNIVPSEASQISFNLKGQINAPYKINEQKVKEILAGKAKKEFSNIIATYENVENAELSIKPIWQNKIPKEIKKINLKVNYP